MTLDEDIMFTMSDYQIEGENPGTKKLNIIVGPGKEKFIKLIMT